MPLSAAHVLEHGADRLARVEAALLGQVSDAIAVRRLERPSEHLEPAGVGLDDVENGPDERRLAGAVRAEQAEDLAASDLQRYIIERERLAEPLASRRRRGSAGWRPSSPARIL